jgi:hypothetical protein
MRKRIITPKIGSTRAATDDSIDILHAAIVEVTSEAEDYPIESAFLSDEKGWRAESSGTQTIRLLFDKPQKISGISLMFEERDAPRTQEFVVRAYSEAGASAKEIVRQQWNFSSPNATRETEEYRVNLPNIDSLELEVTPDISGGTARASLKSLRLDS